MGAITAPSIVDFSTRCFRAMFLRLCPSPSHSGWRFFRLGYFSGVRKACFFLTAIAVNVWYMPVSRIVLSAACLLCK